MSMTDIKRALLAAAAVGALGFGTMPAFADDPAPTDDPVVAEEGSDDGLVAEEGSDDEAADEETGDDVADDDTAGDEEEPTDEVVYGDGDDLDGDGIPDIIYTMTGTDGGIETASVDSRETLAAAYDNTTDGADTETLSADAKAAGLPPLRTD